MKLFNLFKRDKKQTYEYHVKLFDIGDMVYAKKIRVSGGIYELGVPFKVVNIKINDRETEYMLICDRGSHYCFAQIEDLFKTKEELMASI